MALTDLLLPHDSQAMKKIRFSFVRRVSGDLQVLQVTYSTVCCCWKKERRFKIFIYWGRDERPQLTHVAPKNILNLFLLETTFDNETSCTIDTSCCTHFGEEELDNVFGLIWSIELVNHPRKNNAKGKKKVQMTTMTVQEESIKRMLTWRCIFLQISVTFAKIDFLFPSRKSWGGAMVYRFLDAFERREGFAACNDA